MKLELPISIVLLAAGGMLWVGQSKWSNFKLPAWGISNAAATSEKGADTNSNSQQPVAIPLAKLESLPASSESAVFLQSVGANLRLSSPLMADLKVQIRWSDRSYLISGIYAQPGQGSGQSKMELRLGTGSEAVTMKKVCDGRFLYTLQQRGAKQTLEFIDLRRLQETRLSAGLAQADNPLSWIATGGIASLLENLAVAFQLGPPVVSEVNGNTMCTLDGIWRLQPLAELLHESSRLESEPTTFLENLPPQIPSRIRIELVNTRLFGWLPQKVTYLRPIIDSNPPALQVLAEVQLSNPRTFVFEPQEFLNINTDEVESSDVTDLYVDQVHDFGFARQASQNTDDATLLR